MSATKPHRPDYDSVRPRSRAAWRAWLERRHATSNGIWLVMAKKHSGLATVSYNDAVEEALCFGWIDTTVHPIDARFYKQLFTPRKPRSTWAASNKARVARLIAAGVMTDAGLAAIAVAKRNGSWTTLDSIESLRAPAELTDALDADAAARRQWATFTASCRKQFLYWLAGAKRAETRARRVATIVDCASRGVTFAEYYRASRK